MPSTTWLTTSASALGGLLKPHDRIVWGQCAGEPLTLTEAVVAQCAGAGPWSAFVGATFSETLRPGQTAELAISSFGAIGTLRRLWGDGTVAVVPCHSGQVHRYIRDGQIGCDIALVQVSPPGPDGSHSFGVTHDYMGAAVAKARLVVAEVNDQVPWTRARSLFPGDRIHAAIETSRPLIQVGPVAASLTELRIAAHCAAFVEDGMVLQLGIGAIPDTVLRGLRDRRDLGIHAPMVGDAVAELMEAGVITNARKAVHPGVTVTGLLVGTDRLYRLAHGNPAFAVLSSDQVSEERVLAGLSRFVTINSAIEVDLTGQVNAEVANGRHIGAVGGQSDYVRAGHRSEGGRSIIALPATARGGRSAASSWRLAARSPRPAAMSTPWSPNSAPPSCGRRRLRNAPAG